MYFQAVMVVFGKRIKTNQLLGSNISYNQTLVSKFFLMKWEHQQSLVEQIHILVPANGRIATVTQQLGTYLKQNVISKIVSK